MQSLFEPLSGLDLTPSSKEKWDGGGGDSDALSWVYR
jgi:hypothetical protein